MFMSEVIFKNQSTPKKASVCPKVFYNSTSAVYYFVIVPSIWNFVQELSAKFSKYPP